MKLYNTKSGAQNAATRLNKIESFNNTVKYWEVESVVIENVIKYIVQNWNFDSTEIYDGYKIGA